LTELVHLLVGLNACLMVLVASSDPPAQPAESGGGQWHLHQRPV